MTTKNIYTVYMSMLDGNPKLVLALDGKLRKDRDPLNLMKYLNDCCEKACNSTVNKNVTSKHIGSFRNKLKAYCNKKMMGGFTAATIEWNGMVDNAYSKDASTADVLNVDLDTVARPAITPALAASLNQTGGGKREDAIKLLMREISSHCSKHNKTMDKAVKEFLAKDIIRNMRCLMNASVEKDRLLKMR